MPDNESSFRSARRRILADKQTRMDGFPETYAESARIRLSALIRLKTHPSFAAQNNVQILKSPGPIMWWSEREPYRFRSLMDGRVGAFGASSFPALDAATGSGINQPWVRNHASRSVGHISNAASPSPKPLP